MNYPKKIAIGFQEGTCPLKCRKCFAFGEYAKQEKRKSKMSLERAKRLIDEISEFDEIPKVQPHIYTEPFANQDLKIIISYCFDRKIPMSIISNGILVDNEWIDFLADNLNKESTISFSLDAISQKTYEQVRGNYSLAVIEEKILKLSEKCRKNGPRIGVNFVIEEANYHESEMFLEHWKYVVEAVRITVGVDGDKRIPDRFRKDIKEDTGVLCSQLDTVMTIDTDGHVRVCQFDAFGESDFGDVFKEGILNIWQGEKMREYRKRQICGQLYLKDYCYNCEGKNITGFQQRETNDFIINEAKYSVYYNRKRDVYDTSLE